MSGIPVCELSAELFVIARVRCHSASFFMQHQFALFTMRGLTCRVRSVFSVVWLVSFVGFLCPFDHGTPDTNHIRG